MAVGTIYVTIPAVAAAAGIYFFNKQHSKTTEFGGGFRGSMKYLAAKAKTTQMPKLAPQYDGLHSFETLVGH